MPQRKIHSTSKEEMPLVGAGGNTPSGCDCDCDCDCDDAFESMEVGVGSSLDTYEYADTALSTGMGKDIAGLVTADVSMGLWRHNQNSGFGLILFQFDCGWVV
jgi:hypothetical protein